MTAETIHDPVCHMDIARESAAVSSNFEETTYYFCGRGCKMDFDEDPEGILAAEATYDHSQPATVRRPRRPSNTPKPGDGSRPRK